MQHLLLCFVVVCFLQLAHGGLYGLTGPTLGLETISVRTGFQKPIGKPIDTELTAQQLSTVDPVNQIIYIVGFNNTCTCVNLVGLDLTGKVLTNIPLPFGQEVFIGVGQTVDFNTNTGEVLVSGRDPATGNKHHVLSVNPTTKIITSLAIIGDQDVLGGAAAYDAKYNVYWLTFATNNNIVLVRVDLNTGLQQVVPNPINMESMDFDPVKGVVVGVGLKVDSPTNYYRVMLALDSTTNSFTVLGTIPGYFIIESCEGAIDAQNRKYYSLLQPIGHSKKPFQLVEYDFNSNSVTNNPNIGGDDCDTCPWSIHFIN